MTSKSLLLLRHAKSSWDDARLDDHDRPLNGRGRRAASRMGRLIHEQAFDIDLVLCSTAKRTTETANRVFEELKTVPPIEFRGDLYLATTDQMIDALKLVAPPTRCVMLIGHNPGMEEFVEQLTGVAGRFPTAAMAQIELEIDEWTSFSNQTRGRLVQLWKPKELDAD